MAGTEYMRWMKPVDERCQHLWFEDAGVDFHGDAPRAA
jgi:hypothetical protein